MAAIFKTKNQVFAAKVEVTPGTDASPTVGANAVRVQNLNFGPDIQSIDPEEVTGSLDDAAPIFAGGSQRVSFDVGMRSAGTAGTAPDWGVCALGCGMSETLLAADVTGTATGGSVNTIVIEAADIGADHEFNGMVVELTGGTGYNASNPKGIRKKHHV